MFNIASSNNTVQNFQMKKEIASKDARQIMEANIRVETAKINNAWYNGRIDVAETKKTLKEYQRNYDRTAPESLDENTKNQMWRRAKQLKDEFIVGMLSQDELHPVKAILVEGTTKWVVNEEKISANRTVERNTAWYNKNLPKLSEYKNIMRHLNPDNPLASDFEKFRPKQRTV